MERRLQGLGVVSADGRDDLKALREDGATFSEHGRRMIHGPFSRVVVVPVAFVFQMALKSNDNNSKYTYIYISVWALSRAFRFSRI